MLPQLTGPGAEVKAKEGIPEIFWVDKAVRGEQVTEFAKSNIVNHRISPQGGNLKHPNMQPFFVLNYIIRVV